jgi:hypothetical protein
MRLLLDSFWRALAYLLMPRVIGLSLLPLLIAGGASFVLGWFFWESALAGVRETLEGWSLIEPLLKWIDSGLGPNFRVALAALIVVALAVPVVVVASLMLVALLMTPAIVSLVAERRFAQLERKRGASFWQGALWGLGCTALALAASFVTMPFWLIPGVVLIVPPLIWGWLTTRVMAFDVLSEHASREERRSLMGLHGWQLLLMGIITGFLGAAPSMIWAISAMTLVFAPLLMAVSVWLYTLVFAFSALWFAHYLLAALQLQRASAAAAVVMGVPPPASHLPDLPDLPGTTP